jgi:hypothetical protein
MLALFFSGFWNKWMKPIAKKEKEIHQGTRKALPLFKKDALFWTCNSASPKTKQFWGHFFAVCWQ